MTICDVVSFWLYIQKPGLFVDMQIKLADSFLVYCVSNPALSSSSPVIDFQPCLLLIKFNQYSAVNIFDQRRNYCIKINSFPQLLASMTSIIEKTHENFAWF